MLKNAKTKMRKSVGIFSMVSSLKSDPNYHVNTLDKRVTSVELRKIRIQNRAGRIQKVITNGMLGKIKQQ